MGMLEIRLCLRCEKKTCRANPFKRMATSPVAMRRMSAAVGLIRGGGFSSAAVVVDILDYSSARTTIVVTVIPDFRFLPSFVSRLAVCFSFFGCPFYSDAVVGGAAFWS